MLENVRIVMVEPSHSGNIGAAARAMKTMGVTELALVGVKNFPDQQALTLASGADDLLQNALQVDTLADALVGVDLVFGTSARSRHLPWPVVAPREAAEKAAAHTGRSAFVFGRERSGLTNDELAMCHYHLQIPTQPNFSSLNLSQAIQVLAYELRMASLVDRQGSESEAAAFAPMEQVEGFYSHLESTLTAIDFLNPNQPKMLMKRLRRLFNRAYLEETEIHILRGILARVDKLATSANTSTSSNTPAESNETDLP